MALTTDQLTDMQADLGIGSDEGVFTDAELNRLYARANDDYSSAVVLAIRQLTMNAAKLNDYTAGQTSESKSQIFKNLKEMLAYWEGKAQSSTQVKIVGMSYVPPSDRDLPSEVLRDRRPLNRRFRG
jgi:hypothetical protein